MHFLRARITLQPIVALSRLPANIAPLAHNKAKGWLVDRTNAIRRQRTVEHRLQSVLPWTWREIVGVEKRCLTIPWGSAVALDVDLMSSVCLCV